MRIYINQWMEITETTPEAILSRIDHVLQEQDCLLNYLVIDGTEVEDGFLEKLRQEQGKIREIKVETVTRQDAVAYFAEQIESRSRHIFERAEDLSLRFYGRAPGKEDWDELTEVLEASYGLIPLANDVICLKKEGDPNFPVSDQAADRLGEVISLFEKAILSKDETYIADLLHFELAATMEEWIKQIKEKI